MPAHPSTASTIAAGLSGHLDPTIAAEQACEQTGLHESHQGEVSFTIAFVSGRHVAETERIGEIVRDRLRPGALIGVSAGGVIGGESALEDQTGVSILAARIPGAVARPFVYDDLPASTDPDDPESVERLARALRAGTDLRAVFFFADPFSVPAGAMLTAMSRAANFATRGAREAPVLGGMASYASASGQNVLLANERVMRRGAVGLSLHGDLTVDALVSQGARPVGSPMVVTAAKRNIILTLGGRRALEAVQETVASLDPDQQEQLQQGLLIGRAINEYKDRFGRGDFLIRGVIGADPDQGAVAVGDLVRVGQTVQLHVRDAEAAAEDLALLLDAQRLQDPPDAAMLITCNGRGSAMFDDACHDARALSRALGEERQTPLPIAGFFAAGEIGPIGDQSFLHGHTACAALFRSGAPRQPQ